jgi:hypothetical protein
MVCADTGSGSSRDLLRDGAARLGHADTGDAGAGGEGVHGVLLSDVAVGGVERDGVEGGVTIEAVAELEGAAFELGKEGRAYAADGVGLDIEGAELPGGRGGDGEADDFAGVSATRVMRPRSEMWRS